MSNLIARADFTRLRRKLERVRVEVQEGFHAELERDARDAIRQLEDARENKNTRRKIAYQISRQMRAVFIPVTLLGQRREQWPDLYPIYHARIVRGEKTYKGRKRFHVDRRKYAALFRQILTTAFGKPVRGEAVGWKIRFVIDSRKRIRLEIVRDGKRKAGDSTRVQLLTTYMATRYRRSLQAGLIRRIFASAGF